MYNLNINQYKNLLDDITFSVEDIEMKLRSFRLVNDTTKDERVERLMQFPMFVEPFYKFVNENQNIPSQQEFYDLYFKQNAEWFKSQNLSADILKALKARLGRTYPSLVRDIHFALLIKQIGGYDHVVYNRDLDKRNDIDALICIGDKKYGVNLFTDTENAHLYRDKKQTRHQKFDNVTYIELPVSFRGSKQCGDFFLYSKREIDLLNDKIHRAERLNSYSVKV